MGKIFTNDSPRPPAPPRPQVVQERPTQKPPDPEVQEVIAGLILLVLLVGGGWVAFHYWGT